ncbi:hybrid sensor histidine kinase/response regulator [Neorhodopirellula pilleata]|uniref:histidine kinase n=1 Tax=Neorhodopirellula pilleata TaxID=2714738 RepID=A0A5C5ZZJ5_9BACT|nr:PAS domain-containing hybrid sensor histidine kinase/response regulator [Neorhodopirellula pilleata]TWT92992.1 Signal transduction histidine-protein kinase BarA [Neorhodopirellula pilleata]
MIDFFQNLFDTSDFPPRWYCGNWSDFLGWLHVVSDLAIWLAYFAIPAVLVALKQRYEGLLIGTRSIIWTADPKGEFVSPQKSWERYTGQSWSEHRYRGWLQAVHEADREHVQERWNESQRDGSLYHTTGRVWNDASRQYRYFDAEAVPILDGDGNIREWAGTFTDIHQERLAEIALAESEQRANEASRAKTEFLSNMSHEIRTPMTAVLGYTDILLEDETDLDRREHLTTIHSHGNFLLELINDILDLSKIEAGKLEILVEPFSLQELVEDVRRLMRVKAEAQGLSLLIRYDGEVPLLIQSDPKRVRQVLINLIGNAIKFTDYGSISLTVAYAADTNKLKFEVADSGIGISNQQKSRLFQAFSQGDGTITRDYGGTGLGLVISQRLVTMLGGKITVESTPGEGSRFQFTIQTGDVSQTPLVKPRKTIGCEIASQANLQIGNNSGMMNACTFLIVDDRRDIRFLTKHLLEKWNASVVEAVDGEDAIAKVNQRNASGRRFDLILLDMEMPKLDGYETAKRLRRSMLRHQSTR